MDTELTERKKKFEQWMVYEQNLSETTAASYAGYIGAYLRHAGTLKPSPEDAETYRRHRLDRLQAEEITASTVRNSLFAVERYHEMIGEPVELTKPDNRKSLPEYLSMDEVHELLFACDKPRDYGILNVLVYGGLRASEVCNLTMADWDSEERTLTIRDGKGGKDRMVVISEKANHAIRRWVLERGGDDGALFPSRKGGHLTYPTITRIVKRWAREAGLEKNVTAHMLRHTLATHALREGMSVTDLQAQLGHADPKTTLRYTHVVSEGRRDAYDESTPEF